MKILLLTPSFFPQLSGMTYAAHGRAQLLTELGADVTVVASRGELPAGCSYRLRTLPIHGSGLPWSPVRGDVAQLMSVIESASPDAVISEGWYTWGTSLLRQIRRQGHRIVVSSHGAAEKRLSGYSPERLLRAGVYRYFERFVVPRIIDELAAAVVLTEFQDDDRFTDIAQYRRRGVPVFVSPNFSIFDPVAHGRNGAPTALRLLQVGEMAENKNQLAALALLASLPEAFCVEFVYPATNAYLAAVKSACERLGLTHRVRFTEGLHREQLQAVYDRASALLVLSRTEAQPIVAIDGLSRALPFVSTPVGCMSEMSGGIVVDSPGLRDAVLQLHETDAYRDFSAAALACHRQHYGRDVAEHAMAALLHRLAA